MHISPHIYFKTVAMSCITVCFTYFLRMAIFFNTDISQESVATRLGCGGVFIYHFVTNFLLSLTVKEFSKIGKYLVKLWARVRCLVFLTHRVSCGQPAIECTRSACDHISLMTSRYYRTGRYIAHL